MEQKLRSPTLQTVLMVENFINENSGEFKKTELFNNLPKKVMWQTFQVIIDYLQGINKIIIEDIDFLVNTDSTSYTIAQKTRNINRRYDEVVSIILQADGRWKWDDTNNTSQPTTSINMTSETTAVAIPDTTYLTINRVEVKDVNGNFYKLTPFNEREITNQAMTEFLKTPGRPLYYEKVGGFLNLYPKPSSANVTLTSGLKIYFQRDASYFLTTDTTKVPGFAASFHRILSFGGALDYAISKGMAGK